VQADRSGWVPIKPQEEGAEEPLSSPTTSRGRSFTRTMESTVPMYCNLEVSLGLAVVEQKAASLLTGATAAGALAYPFLRMCTFSVSTEVSSLHACRWVH
jgi:hypothetical protein